MPKKGSYIDIKGQRYGKLIAIEFCGIRSRRRTYWKCVCDCGNVTYVDTAHLRSGHTTSCGCAKIERIGNLNKKTGKSKTKLYYCFRNMLNRCYWEKSDMYNDYGGRGISVCGEWTDKEKGFENFYEWSLANGYKEGLSLDRVDVNGIYEPSNCRWVDALTQANNKRNTHFLVIDGKKDTVANHARNYGISYWNLLHYSKGGKNMKYPDLNICEVNNEL